jgi:hypothetical protein
MTAPADTQLRHMMMLTAQEIEMLRHQIARERRPVVIQGTGGRRVTFRICEGKLVSKEERPDGTIVRYEVASDTDIQAMMARPDATPADPEQLERLHVMEQIRSDHADYTPERVEYMADLVMESRKTMLRLLAVGIEPKAAQMMVTQALKLSDMDQDRMRELMAEYTERRATAQPEFEATLEPMVVGGGAATTDSPVSPPAPTPPGRESPPDPMGGMF